MGRLMLCLLQCIATGCYPLAFNTFCNVVILLIIILVSFSSATTTTNLNQLCELLYCCLAALDKDRP